MAVYTTNVMARKRAIRTVTRRRLRGLPRAKAASALKHLKIALRSDSNAMARSESVPAESLIFLGDAKFTAKAVAVVALLESMLSDSLTINKA